MMSGATLRSFSDPEAQAFRQEVQAWLRDSDWHQTELGLTADQQVKIRREWDKKLFEAGYAGLTWPKRFGGRELDAIREVILHEELARAHAPESYSRIGRVMAGPLLIRFGTEDQQRRLLPGILDGNQVWCLGYSEPNAGSDLAAVLTTATRDGDSYLVTGRKIWTSYAHHADRCILLARSSLDRPKHQNISILLLDMHQANIDVRTITTITGDHHFSEVVFDGAVVSVDDRLGPENEGWSIFRESLAFERGVTLAMNHYIEMCREAAVLRECCAPATGDPGVVRLADQLNWNVELTRWHIVRVTEMDANGLDSRRARLVLKLWWSEAWQSLCDFGARVSCPKHVDFWRYQYFQSRAATIYVGTSEIQRNTIARAALRV